MADILTQVIADCDNDIAQLMSAIAMVQQQVATLQAQLAAAQQKRSDLTALQSK